MKIQKRESRSSLVSSKKNSAFRKLWHFIWEDDSPWSWAVNIILAFILIKFIIYPVLGILFGTSFPIVAVVSGSMEHAYAPRLDNTGHEIITSDGKMIYTFCSDYYYKDKSFISVKDFRSFDDFWSACGDWYEQRGIQSNEFKNFDFSNGFNKGDIMILHGTKPADIDVGDVVVFRGKLRSDPIIHRVVNISVDESGEYHFMTKGDHNENSIVAIGENNITKNEYLAKAVFKIPYLGWIKIFFTYVITGFKPII